MKIDVCIKQIKKQDSDRSLGDELRVEPAKKGRPRTKNLEEKPATVDAAASSLAADNFTGQEMETKKRGRKDES